MSDNELDKLFKEAAEGFKAPQDSSAWQDMAGRLDQAGVTTTAFWNWKSISTMAVVGAVSVGAVLYFPRSEPNLPKAKDEIVSNQPVEGVAPEKAVENTLAETNSTSSYNEKAVIDASSKKENDATPIVVEKNSNNPVVKAQVVDAGDLQGGERVIQNNNESKKPVGVLDEEISSLAAVQVSAVETQASGSSLESSTPQNQRNATDEGTTEVKKNSQVNSDSLVKQPEDEKVILSDSAISDEEKTKPEESKKEFRPTLGVKLAIAPDYTSVKSSTPDRLGIGYGILLEYQFSEHWSIATGGIWTKKIYTAYDVEYNGYNADWVDGDCRMWDIPLNVYYNFSPNRSFSFYAGLGFSSYLMNEENYIFYVETPYAVYDYPQQIKGENNEWFKILNISLGMQLKLNNKLTLQFEPFLKAPLAGVGEGEVSLASAGAFFNLRFDIPINKPE